MVPGSKLNLWTDHSLSELLTQVVLFGAGIANLAQLYYRLAKNKYHRINTSQRLLKVDAFSSITAYIIFILTIVCIQIIV